MSLAWWSTTTSAHVHGIRALVASARSLRLIPASSATSSASASSGPPQQGAHFLGNMATRAASSERHPGDGGAGMDAARASRRTYALYRPSRKEALIAEGLDVRTVHMVRHAQGTHNVPVPGTCQYRHPKNHDARLTAFGEQQCDALATSSADLVAGAQLVITSPLTRCVQTALLSFPALAAADPKAVPFLAHESVRETVNFPCDAHRPLSLVAAEFPRVDFSHCPTEHDRIWNAYAGALPEDHDGHRESANLASVADRGREFFEWLGERGETTVVVSSHSAFLRCLFSWGHEGGVRAAPDQSLRGVCGGRYGTQWEDADVTVVDYGDDEVFEAFMRDDWENCELRTFLVAY